MVNWHGILHSVRSPVVRIEHDKRMVETETIMKRHSTYSVPIVSPASVCLPSDYIMVLLSIPIRSDTSHQHSNHKSQLRCIKL